MAFQFPLIELGYHSTNYNIRLEEYRRIFGAIVEDGGIGIIFVFFSFSRQSTYLDYYFLTVI